MNDMIRDQISEIKDGFSHKKHSGEDRNICGVICHLSNRFNLLAGKGHQITVAKFRTMICAERTQVYSFNRCNGKKYAMRH